MVGDSAGKGRDLRFKISLPLFKRCNLQRVFLRSGGAVDGAAEAAKLFLDLLPLKVKGTDWLILFEDMFDVLKSKIELAALLGFTEI